MAAARPASARLVAVAAAGRTTSYTTLGDTTAVGEDDINDLSHYVHLHRYLIRLSVPGINTSRDEQTLPIPFGAKHRNVEMRWKCF